MKIIYTIPFFLIATIAFAQEKIKHKISKGETLYGIAKKYDVKESDILDLNPKIKNTSLPLDAVLWIPNKNNPANTNLKKEEKIATITHEVLAKETLYSISRKYQTSVDLIKKANPTLKGNEISVGSKIIIFVSETFSNTIFKNNIPKTDKTQKIISQNNDETLTHLVVAKETKYGISKRYNISIEELEKLNPKTIKGLNIGEELIIYQGKTKAPVVVSTSQTDKKEKIFEIEKKTETAPNLKNFQSKAELLIAKASENLGVPYCYGGTDKDGFDCSGLVFYSFKAIDMVLPRTSSDMAINAGIKIETNQAQRGDLIFFDTMNQGNVSHVGMVTEVLDDEIKFIHASSSQGVTISSTKEDYFAQRLVQVNRVLEN